MLQTLEATEDLDEVSAAPARPAQSPRIVLWLVVLGLGVLFIPLLLVGQAIKDENESFGAQLERIQKTLTSTAPPELKSLALKGQLSQARLQLAAIQNLKPTLDAGHVDWPAVISALSDYDSTRVTISSLTQVGDRIILTGVADSEMSVMVYAETLRQSKQLGRVVVQAITLQGVPTPAKGKSAITVTPTPVANGNERPAAFTLAVQLKANDHE